MLLAIGGLLLLGLVADEVARRTRLPRVTLLLLFGVVAGPSGLALLPKAFSDWYEFLASVALSMVAFLLGGTLSITTLRRHGKAILFVSTSVVLVTILIIGVGLATLGVALPLALLLAGIGTATDPAATQDVIRQVRANGPFTSTLSGIVAIDDAIGLIAFSLLLVAAKALIGNGSLDSLGHGLWELFGAIGVGAFVGLPAAALTGRIRPGEPMQSEAIGIVLICAGLAIWLNVSFLLAVMVAGFIIVNFARHHRRPFHEIEHVEWPFMVMFFVLAGASVATPNVMQLGAIGVAYIVLRIVSRIAGAWTGAWLGDAARPIRCWMGVALMPQAGVAIGMALAASAHIGAMKETLLAAAIGSTVFFELVGPVLTHLALRRVGEAE